MPMLIFTGLTTEMTANGERHMMLFASPRAPGVHYKVETTRETAYRLRAIINCEIHTSMMIANELLQGGIEDDCCDADPNHRL